MAQPPRFLHRKSYRRRRLMDAVRLLPFLGLVLWGLPLLWPVAEGPAEAPQHLIRTSSALLYLFGVWVLLVLAGWLLWRRTRGLSDAEIGIEPGPEG